MKKIKSIIEKALSLILAGLTCFSGTVCAMQSREKAESVMSLFSSKRCIIDSLAVFTYDKDMLKKLVTTVHAFYYAIQCSEKIENLHDKYSYMNECFRLVLGEDKGNLDRVTDEIKDEIENISNPEFQEDEFVQKCLWVLMVKSLWMLSDFLKLSEEYIGDLEGFKKSDEFEQLYLQFLKYTSALISIWNLIDNPNIVIGIVSESRDKLRRMVRLRKAERSNRLIQQRSVCAVKTMDECNKFVKDSLGCILGVMSFLGFDEKKLEILGSEIPKHPKFELFRQSRDELIKLFPEQGFFYGTILKALFEDEDFVINGGKPFAKDESYSKLSFNLMGCAKSLLVTANVEDKDIDRFFVDIRNTAIERVCTAKKRVLLNEMKESLKEELRASGLDERETEVYLRNIESATTKKDIEKIERFLKIEKKKKADEEKRRKEEEELERKARIEAAAKLELERQQKEKNLQEIEAYKKSLMEKVKKLYPHDECEKCDLISKIMAAKNMNTLQEIDAQIGKIQISSWRASSVDVATSATKTICAVPRMVDSRPWQVVYWSPEVANEIGHGYKEIWCRWLENAEKGTITGTVIVGDLLNLFRKNGIPKDKELVECRLGTYGAKAGARVICYRDEDTSKIVIVYAGDPFGKVHKNLLSGNIGECRFRPATKEDASVKQSDSASGSTTSSKSSSSKSDDK